MHYPHQAGGSIFNVVPISWHLLKITVLDLQIKTGTERKGSTMWTQVSDGPEYVREKIFKRIFWYSLQRGIESWISCNIYF